MKDQLSNAPAQTVDQAPEAAPAPDHRLPPAVFHQVTHMQPGDGEALAAVIDQHPELTRQILEVASMHVGATTVRQAIALRHNVYEPNVRVSPELHADVQSIAGDTSYPAQSEPAAAPAQAEPAATAGQAEPAWVAHARTYNAANLTLLDEFNELTDSICSGPVDIAHWQRHNGVTADGMVGPHTIAAARVFRSNANRYAADSQGSQADARPPV